jgi:hypothetical protein
VVTFFFLVAIFCPHVLVKSAPFPQQQGSHMPPLTPPEKELLDQFAGQAMQVLLHHLQGDQYTLETIPDLAYKVALAMMEKRFEVHAVV